MRTLAAALALVALASCKRNSEENEAARKRIFSPEEAIGAAAEARQPLDARSIESDAELAHRVLHMPQAEVAERLGPHKAQTRVQFAWFRGPGLPDGGAEISLSAETSLADGPHGDYSIRLSNDHNQGFEIFWVNGQALVKSLYGPFRKRRTDRTDPARVREQALAALPSFDRLARGLKLKLDGETRSEGRRALRFSVTGFGARPHPKDDRDLPPVEFPGAAGKPGAPDPDTARRLELWQKEEPISVSGTVLIDAETAAPLGCDLQGRFKVEADSKAGPVAELDLHSVLVTQAIGKDPNLKEPKFEPEPSVAHAVKDPLRFLGKVPSAPGAASTAEPTEADEPAVEEDDDKADDEPAAATPPAEKEKSRTKGQ
jgi:hypothetical protein